MISDKPADDNRRPDRDCSQYWGHLWRVYTRRSPRSIARPIAATIASCKHRVTCLRVRRVLRLCSRHFEDNFHRWLVDWTGTGLELGFPGPVWSSWESQYSLRLSTKTDFSVIRRNSVIKSRLNWHQNYLSDFDGLTK